MPYFTPVTTAADRQHVIYAKMLQLGYLESRVTGRLMAFMNVFLKSFHGSVFLHLLDDILLSIW